MYGHLNVKKEKKLGFVVWNCLLCQWVSCSIICCVMIEIVYCPVDCTLFLVCLFDVHCELHGDGSLTETCSS